MTKKILSSLNHVFLLALLFGLYKNPSFAQDKTLDQNKYADCLLKIPIDYKDIEANYLEAGKYADMEIVMIRTKSNGQIKKVERGFIKTWTGKDGKKGVFFEHKPSPDDKANSASFPIFNEKNTYCYSAMCFDSK